ncbi:MAG: hypothetical protein IPL99_29470 [Candidatus Competibacteraceae bacterium]|nr:hypothetical protein [Candidatus Competibacteraceae bacterium]
MPPHPTRRYRLRRSAAVVGRDDDQMSPAYQRLAREAVAAFVTLVRSRLAKVVPVLCNRNPEPVHPWRPSVAPIWIKAPFLTEKSNPIPVGVTARTFYSATDRDPGRYRQALARLPAIG